MPTPPTGDLSRQAETVVGAEHRHEQGRKIYNFRCYFCHGYSGDAKTLAASYLDPPPRDFTQTSLNVLTRDKMLQTLREGKPGTAMQSFANTLSAQEMSVVVDFVREEFMQRRAANTAYHTAENGWPDHERYRAAFPFARGEIPLDTLDQDLTPEQLEGKRLFMNSCVSCHDRARVKEEGTLWEPFAVSYPRNQYSHKDPKMDAESRATPYSQHDVAPSLANLSAAEQSGQKLFLGNCAFCHGADGSGQNWIGSFLQPHPRDLRNAEFMARMTEVRLRQVIENGLEGTTMSAWKGILTPAQINDLIAYIKRAFPALKQAD